MGQYHLIVNKTRREFLDPHSCGDGLKLMEFGCSGMGTMTALTLLLAAHDGRGGGDFQMEDSPVTGSWAGDEIVIAGDYGESRGEPGSHTEGLDDLQVDDDESPTLYDIAREHFEDVGPKVMQVLKGDAYLADKMRTPWN